jgi:hypothetical protein
MINYLIYALSLAISFLFCTQLNFETIYINLYITSLIAAIPFSILIWAVLTSIKEKVVDKKEYNIEDYDWNNPKSNKDPEQIVKDAIKKAGNRSHLRRIK